MLNLYLFFHLNIMYSSIPEDRRQDVIERCYWPLLRLAKKLHLPLGIEASGYTLETIAAIDPSWVAEFRRLLEDGFCEVIGSGYAQIIGPLVPAEVNAANLRIGNQVYENLLGRLPQLALVNEQAYSAGLIQHYLDAGYRAIIMEWDNPARVHPGWHPEWRYLPQVACGQHGEEIPIIWNQSIAFQKFQRYVHSELSLASYLGYLQKHQAESPRAFPLYGNDAEIFDFRPGRYHTEAELTSASEWERIAELISDLQQDNSLRFISPRQVLDFLSSPGAGQKLHLESPEQPVPVKKQGKYNLIRWAVTGRDDLNINTECWRIYQALKNSQDTTDADWRELCYLWSSDFRTHITDKRWHEYQQRFQKFWSVLTVSMPSAELAAPQVDIHSMSCPHALGGHPQNQQRMDSRLKHAGVTVGLFKPSKPKLVSAVKRQSDLLTLETELTKITLNPRRGLAIDGLWFKHISNEKLIGTLPHGFYDDISLGADFYSAHLIYEMPGHPKITDLNPVQPEVVEFSDSVEIKGEIQTLLGPLQKCFRLYHDSPRVELEYVPSWPNLPLGSLRLGLLTFYPTAFDRDTLYYRTCNGGFLPETFHVGGKKFEHGSPVSFLVSASHGLGVTDGLIEIGDDRCGVRVEVDKTKSALIAMIAYRELADSFFLRLAFSAREMDDTCLNANRAENCSRSFRIAISPITRTGNGKQQIH